MSLSGRTEKNLLQRFRDGERAALEDVYRAHVDLVARTVASTLRRYDGSRLGGGWRGRAAELPDLVQEVFARAFEPRARRSFDGVRDYAPFLNQIARNTAIDYLRRIGREVPRDPDELSRGLEAVAISEDAVADPRTVALVGQYVACLPTDLRRVHQALYVEGLSQREAADALALGRQVVRRLEATLREGLKAKLMELDETHVLPGVTVSAWQTGLHNQKAR